MICELFQIHGRNSMGVFSIALVVGFIDGCDLMQDLDHESCSIWGISKKWVSVSVK
jgi:hypothetical protein